MTNNDKVLGYLGLARKAGKLIFGTDACIEAIDKRKVKLVIVVKDASDRTKNKVKTLCIQKEIFYIEWGDSKIMSKAIGKQNKVVIGIKDKNLSDAIKKVINGGELDE